MQISITGIFSCDWVWAFQTLLLEQWPVRDHISSLRLLCQLQQCPIDMIRAKFILPHEPLTMWEHGKFNLNEWFMILHVVVGILEVVLSFLLTRSQWVNGTWVASAGLCASIPKQNHPALTGVICLLLTVYPKKYAYGFALLCFVVVIHWLIFPYASGLLHWHCGNLTNAPVPAKQPWWIWINTSCEFIMNDCITTTKQSTTKPCSYFLGYTVYLRSGYQHCIPAIINRIYIESTYTAFVVENGEVHVVCLTTINKIRPSIQWICHHEIMG